jgi:hypothetical protein
VRLEGVNAENRTVYDLKLAVVTLGVNDDTKRGRDRLVLDYSKVGLSTVSQNADGSLLTGLYKLTGHRVQFCRGR